MLVYAALTTGCYRRMGHGVGQQILPIMFSPQKVRKVSIFMMKAVLLWQRTLIMIPLILDAPHFVGGVHFPSIGICI